MLSERIRSRILQFGRLPLIALAVTIAGTLVTYGYAKSQEYRRIQNEFHELAQVKAQRVYLRVDGYERSLLDLRGLFAASETVTDAEFKRYLDGVDVSHRYPALFRIGYTPLVTDANRASIETLIRSKGVRNFQAPATNVPYLPVLYGYPTTGNALGMDLNADPVRREALSAARDTGQPQITRRLILRFSSPPPSGFILYLPLYTTGLAPATISQRRQALSGYLYAVFRTDELISSTIGPDLNSNMNLVLFDGNTTNPDHLAYDSGNMVKVASNKHRGSYTSTVHLLVGGRPWTFLFAAKPAFIQANQSFLPDAVLIGGLLVCGLATWLASAIAKRLRAERKIRQLAFYDELTGLPNRTKLRKDLAAAIRLRQQTEEPFAILLVELIRFREINYTLGHHIGDALLKQVSTCLRQIAGEKTTVARISNIQFGVLLPKVHASEAVDLAKRLVVALERPFPVGEINYELGSHIGIAFFPGHGDDPDVLMRHADIALNQARKAARDYIIYDATQDPYKPERLALLGDFRNAVKQGQLQLYCQPKADLRTSAITSGEALVRWQHPTYGLLSPDKFIPLIEPTELIQLLTKQMLEAAIQQCYEWRQKNLHIPLAVNLSTRNLLDPNLPDIINGMMQTWGADTSCVELEITESGMMLDPDASLHVLNQLHMMGLKLFVDDFGTGYSSLSYLMKMPINTIKIDHSFTMNMIKDPDAKAIIKATIEMAHNMGMKVVAEGTASREIWEALKQLGCDEAQGYYISPPFPAKDLPAWLKQSPWKQVSTI